MVVATGTDGELLDSRILPFLTKIYIRTGPNCTEFTSQAYSIIGLSSLGVAIATGFFLWSSIFLWWLLYNKEALKPSTSALITVGLCALTLLIGSLSSIFEIAIVFYPGSHTKINPYDGSKRSSLYGSANVILLDIVVYLTFLVFVNISFGWIEIARSVVTSKSLSILRKSKLILSCYAVILSGLDIYCIIVQSQVIFLFTALVVFVSIAVIFGIGAWKMQILFRKMLELQNDTFKKERIEYQMKKLENFTICVSLGSFGVLGLGISYVIFVSQLDTSWKEYAGMYRVCPPALIGIVCAILIYLTVAMFFVYLRSNLIVQNSQNKRSARKLQSSSNNSHSSNRCTELNIN